MHFFVTFLIVSALVVLTKSCDTTGITQSNVENRDGRSWRLPNTTYPMKYYLHLTTWIHQEVRNFIGNATLEVAVKENTSELVLHARDLNIRKFHIQDLTTGVEIGNLRLRTIDDLLIIDQFKRNDDLNSTKAHIFVSEHILRLEIHYTGVINKKKKGFTLMSYQDEQHKTIYGAYTYMEPFYARMVLPCYDEPKLRANFTISIKHGSNYTAISNMPARVRIKQRKSNMTTTIFMETPPMSTYLLGFVISNYKYIAQEANGTMHRIFLPPNTKICGTLALQNAINVVRIFTEYLNITYTLPKLDHIAINGFLGGMENWGLITYGSDVFVNDSKTDIHRNFEDINLQNHEIIHQWLGNLVSPAWWDSLWLKEGFAEYYSFVLTNMSRPAYTAMERFNLYTCYTNALYHEEISIADYVEKLEDILEKFVFAVYFKAPCIIQMFEHAFEESNFRRGVSNFIKSNAFSAVNESNLFEHLQAALLASNHTSHWNHTRSVQAVMSNWLHAKSLPEVTIERDYNNSNILRIQQKPTLKHITEFWWIPLNFVTATQPHFENTKAIYYMPPVAEVTLNLSDFNITLNRNDWLLANKQSTGFYMVYYDKANLALLAHALQTNHNLIHKYNRAQILRSIPKLWRDAPALVTALELLKYLPKERDKFVWSAIYTELKDLSDSLYYTKCFQLFNSFIEKSVRSLYLESYGKPAEETYMLDDIACLVNMPECLVESKELYLAQSASIFSDDIKFAPFWVCNAAKTFNNTEYESQLQYLLKEPEDFGVKYWQHLHCTAVKSQYAELLEASLAALDSRKKRQDVLRFWGNLLKTPVIMKWNLTYNFLYKQIPKLQSIGNATYELCTNMKSEAVSIRKLFYAQYIELMKLCIKQLLLGGVIKHSNEIMPPLAEIGENFCFEHQPAWPQETQRAYEWLKEHTFL